ncbi:MAG: Type 1 glutamine amidotransferase-like domain-containing protein [Bacilli bacterium]|nr:Type 1 glutamine amidotransferase-like domain-containing protein [Bacilli bacterium]
MKTVILTSCLDLYYKDNEGNRIAQNFGNENGILDTIKNENICYGNFLFVSNGFEDKDVDEYYKITCESFELTLPFKNYNILNHASKNNVKNLVENADFIFLCGGHLPTQNKFFNDINLKEIIKNTNALVVGGSAGSMNCASLVYCPPELEGESEDINFNRYLSGLCLTNINILPHYDVFKNYVLDNKDYINEIILPDTYKNKVIALVDGSYIVIKDNISKVYGENYLMFNGKIKRNYNDNLMEVYNG